MADRDGTYQKGRRRITKPVTKVPPGAVPDPGLLREVGDVVRQLDKDRLVMSKSTGWLLAGAVVVALGLVAYLGASLFTRVHQLDHVRDELGETNRSVEEMLRRVRALERRQVELETAVENLRERRRR